VAHAEASAKTVDAAVTAAAAQLGLRSDQVDIEVLEDPVPSTFGYIGTPARVRVTPRSGSAPDTSGTSLTRSEAGASAPTAAASGQAASDPAVTSAADQANHDGLGASSSPPSASAQAATSAPASTPGGASSPGDVPTPGDVPARARDAIDPATSPPTSPLDPAATTPRPPTLASDPIPASDAALDPASPSGSALGLASDPSPALASDPAPSAPTAVTQRTNDSNLTSPSYASDSSASSVAGVGTGSGAGSEGEQVSAGFGGLSSGTGSAGADSVVDPDVGTVANAGSGGTTPSIGAPETATVAAPPTAHPSPATAPGGNGDRASEVEATRGSSPLSTPPAAPPPPGSEPSSTTRPPRRTYRDEPIEPEMVEADTERAGDFLEGLLDALDVDGDLTTWVDEVGGHIDLEGSDLDVLVGSNGETLDALQELTRLAVLRQSKRRVRLLLDINGFRARQREQLITIVKATAEQVIRTREDHEFQPMSPAERKIVHDAVAAIDGAQTESLGEDPHRRVVIRPT
jgi:spoIIIJ-associated protein